MVFCGQCGYQLSPGDIICPRCGAKTDADLIESDPGTYNPTEISQVVPGSQRTQADSPRTRKSQPRIPAQPAQSDAEGRLVLGLNTPNEQLANDVTVATNSQMYVPSQASFPNYPPQASPGSQSYYTGAYPSYPTSESAAVARLLQSSHRGKTGALLLILFGLLLLTGAIVILLLTLQGIIFSL